MSNIMNTSDNSAHQAVRFQDAQAIYYPGQLERQRNAAGIGTFTMQSPPNFHKPTSSKVGLHDTLWKNWQTRQQQHFTNGMSFKNGLRSMPTSRSEQKWRLKQKTHVTRFLLKVCNLLIMKNFGRISQGVSLRTWPAPMRRSSVCKAKSARWRKKL